MALVIGHLHASPFLLLMYCATDGGSCDGFSFIFFLHPDMTTIRQWHRRGRSQLELASGLLDDILSVFLAVTILSYYKSCKPALHCPSHRVSQRLVFRKTLCSSTALTVLQINLLPNHLCLCLPVTLDRFHQHASQTLH